MTIAPRHAREGHRRRPGQVVVDGKVTHAARQCMEVIAEYDMILATGHIAPEEMLPVVLAAREAKVNRVIITHPEFPATYLDQDQQRALGKYDVMFERCFTQPTPRRSSGRRCTTTSAPSAPAPPSSPPTLARARRPGLRRAWACSSRTCSTTLLPLRDRNDVPPQRRPDPGPDGARQGLAARAVQMIIIRASNWRPVIYS